jgi:ribosomal protein L21E
MKFEIGDRVQMEYDSYGNALYQGDTGVVENVQDYMVRVKFDGRTLPITLAEEYLRRIA